MSDNDNPTWYDAEHDAQVAALECYADSVANESGIDGDDAAHEHADNTQDTIYTWRAHAIWADSSHVQRCGDQLPDYGVDESADIDRRINLCVYIAIHEAYAAAWRELEDIDAPTHAVSDYAHTDAHTYAAYYVGTEDECGEWCTTSKAPVGVIVRDATPAEIEQAIIEEGAEILGLRDAVTA